MSLPVFLQQPVSGVSPADVDAAAGGPAPMPETASRPVKRTKLWELNHKYHCPVIGTCLPLDELVKFARRFDFGVSLKDEFAMHVRAVVMSGTRNATSEAIQKHLDRKYLSWLVRFERAKTDADVLALWRAHYARGEVAGAMWAALTHKAASEETRHVVYADIHMLSHQVGAGQAADARRLAYLEKENAELKAGMEQRQRQHARTEADLRQQLRKAMAERESARHSGDEVAALQARLTAFESGAAMIEMGRRLTHLTAANEQLRVAAARVPALGKALKAARAMADELARERDELAVERDTLERLLLAGDADADEEPCNGQCSSCDPVMQGRCVLCVGGRTGLVAQYRALAGRLGIRLIHHDGGQEEALSRLPDMIDSADAVLCPTDCVSHSAYYQLKRQCKRQRQALPAVQGRWHLRLRRGAGAAVVRPAQPVRRKHLAACRS